jgi:hypothetical protein
MTILSFNPKSTYEISLESTDGELCFPSSFISSNGFNVTFQGNCAHFHPIEVATSYDPRHFEKLLEYCIEASASKVLDRSFKEKRFFLTIHRPEKNLWSEGACRAYDCQLTGFRFLDVDRLDMTSDAPNLILTFQPRYLGYVGKDQVTFEVEPLDKDG